MSKRIGILTYHASCNYGAFLQAYALASYVESVTNETVEIIDYHSVKATSFYKQGIKQFLKNPGAFLYHQKKIRVFQHALQSNRFLSEKSLCSDDLEEFRDFLFSLKYDLIIVGSDEIWKLDGFRGFPNAYWLPGVKGTHKISFAASSRNEIQNLDQKTVEDVKLYLSDFDYIGVRDTATKKLIEQITGLPGECCLNCDPTFLWDFGIDKEEAKKNIAKKYRLDPSKKTLCLMIEKPDVLSCLPRDVYRRYNCISVFKHIPGTKGMIPPDPFEWMEIVAGSDALITTFFHGMVFSIKNATPFLIIEPRNIRDPSLSKSYDLLERNQASAFFSAFSLLGAVETEKRLHSFLEMVDHNRFCFDYKGFVQNECERTAGFLDGIEKAISKTK